MALYSELARIKSDESGGSLLEFAVSAMLLLTVMFGFVEYARAIYTDHFVSYAATEAARYASLRGSTYTTTCASVATFSCAATSANITTFVQKMAPAGVAASSLTATTTWSGKTPAGVACRAATGTNSPGCVVQVKVICSFAFVLPFISRTNLALTSTAAYAISQ